MCVCVCVCVCVFIGLNDTTIQPMTSGPVGDAHGHGPYPITNSDRTLLSAWLKQGRDWLML